MNFTQTTVLNIFTEIIKQADKQVTMTPYNGQNWIEALREHASVT